MGDWDAEEADDIVAQKINDAWDDDLGDGVPDSWDAPEPTVVKPQPVTEKIPLAERIRLKEEKRRKEKEEKLKRQEEERLEQPMTERERERLAEEAELGLLQATFGPTPAVVQPKISDFDSLDPRTKEDFNKLNDLLREKLRTIEKSPHFPAFVENFIRDAITEMDVDFLKSINTTILAVITEKQKMNKGKVKKKSKGKLVVERANDYNFEDDAEPDEYDDFM